MVGSDILVVIDVIIAAHTTTSSQALRLFYALYLHDILSLL